MNLAAGDEFMGSAAMWLVANGGWLQALALLELHSAILCDECFTYCRCTTASCKKRNAA